MRQWGLVVAGMLVLVSARRRRARDSQTRPIRRSTSSRRASTATRRRHPEPPPRRRCTTKLTLLFIRVTTADLTKYFKSEGLGVGPDGPTTTDVLPRDDVTITRDRFNVPHVDAETREAGIWAAGWISGADRHLLGEQARYNARVAAIDAPGLSALDLISSLQNLQPSEQTEAEVAKRTEVLESKGKEGRAVLRDIDTFISGINDHIKVMDLPDEPWTRNDVFAVNALKGQFVGQEAATRRGARSSSRASPTPSAPSAA